MTLATLNRWALGVSSAFVFSLPSLAQAPVSSSDKSGTVWAELLSIMLPLGLIVVGLLAVLFWARRRATAQFGSGPLVIEQVLGVGTRERIVLLSVGSRKLIVGVTPASISRLGEVSKETDVSLTP